MRRGALLYIPPFLGQQYGDNILTLAAQSGDASTLAWALAMVRTKLTAEDRLAALLQADQYGKNFMLWAAVKGGTLSDTGVQSEMEKIDDVTMTKVLTKIAKASGLPLCPCWKYLRANIPTSCFWYRFHPKSNTKASLGEGCPKHAWIKRLCSEIFY